MNERLTESQLAEWERLAEADDAANASFAAAARTAVPELLAEVERLRSDADTLATQTLFVASAAEVALSRVAELEALIDEHEFAAEEVLGYGASYACCPECRRARRDRSGHTEDCSWGRAAANHRARVSEGVQS